MNEVRLRFIILRKQPLFWLSWTDLLRLLFAGGEWTMYSTSTTILSNSAKSTSLNATLWVWQNFDKLVWMGAVDLYLYAQQSWISCCSLLRTLSGIFGRTIFSVTWIAIRYVAVISCSGAIQWVVPICWVMIDVKSSLNLDMPKSDIFW